MAFTQSQLDALEASLSLGSTKVKYQDREVEYRSLDEMMRLRNLMRTEMGLSPGQIKKVNPYFDQGLR